MIGKQMFEHYLESLLEGNRSQCRAVVEDLLRADIDVKELYTGLFQESLYRVGELWEGNVISVAVEHLASAITESLFSLVYPRIFAARHTGRKAVISCVANEYHQIGGKMVADIFELHGWDGYFLGANTPVEDLLGMIGNKKPDLVGLSVAVSSNFDNLLDAIEKIRAAFRDVPILAGGQAFRRGGADLIAGYEGVKYIASLSDLEQEIDARSR